MKGIRTRRGLAHAAAGLGLAVAMLVAAAAPAGAETAAWSQRADGRIWAWGWNGDGQAGNGTDTNYVAAPIQVPVGTRFTAISASDFDSAAIDSAGRVWAWGFNSFGQIGDGTTDQRDSPVQVQLPRDVRIVAIAAGPYDTLAIDSKGRTWAWGDNNAGELGIGTASLGSHSTTPVLVHTPAGVRFVAVAANGLNVLALDTQGRAWTWGNNSYGQLGIGTVAAGPNPTPVQVHMPAGVRFTAISVGYTDEMALDTTGRAWAWGDDATGALGDGTTTFGDQPTPVAVHMPAGVRITAISAGYLHSIALDSQGRAWAWGNDRLGQLGDASTVQQVIPTAVHMPKGVRFTEVAAGYFSSVALDSTGRAWAWGDNSEGEFGDGVIGGSSLTPVAAHMPNGVRFTEISAHGRHVLALSDAINQCW
jgi:alpha-tubulin suppressor-like RCC1 family protein